MEKYLNIAILLTISLVFANCIPTSVLVDTKEQSLGGSSINDPSHNKGKIIYLMLFFDLIDNLFHTPFFFDSICNSLTFRRTTGCPAVHFNVRI